MKENSFFKQITYTEGIYPKFSIDYIQNPSKVYAIPLLGILIKAIALIPVVIIMAFVAIWWFIAVWLINPFVVLMTEKYWLPAYNVSLSLIKMSVKATSYMYGLTDKYPGFDFNLPEGMSLDLPMPEKPRRLYAIPLVGIIVRFVFLIPYFIFSQIISQAATIGVFLLAWAGVLFQGKYPEGIFELARDHIRVGASSYAYMAGLSDRYPSFYISMAHDKIKIILIAIAIILFGINFANGNYNPKNKMMNNNQYNNNLNQRYYP